MPRDHFAYGLVHATVGIAGRHEAVGFPPSEPGLPESESPDEAPPLPAGEVPPLEVDEDVVPPLTLVPPFDVVDVSPLERAAPPAAQLDVASQL
ncbi:MAG TPA: hypothetical protein VHC69_28125 [Polyangiaceae bacterium]|nr:hypothetical protein [Polyangiaceae bacterium]